MDNQQPSDHDRADVERVRADENKIQTLATLKTRVEQNQKSFRQASERIDACKALLKRSPQEYFVLNPTIEIWTRLRRYHDAQILEAKTLGNELAKTMVDPAWP